ncbi:MAG TPA: fatty acid desaturase [Rectinemataceae bacterium]|nr:fatty acid desaturase [Rectinemataceae bacterium]
MKKPEWLLGIRRFEKIDTGRSARELLDSILPYLALFAAMYAVIRLGLPYWIALLLAIPAAGFLVRVFIILHDCGHYSFSNSTRVNAIVGYICGILTFSSFPDFRRSHAIHHATVGNLDKRGIGDVWTMTVEEYRAASPARRALYRFVRNPFVLFLILAPLDFVVLARLPHSYSKRSDIIGTMGTNLALAAIIVLAALTIGIGPYLAIQGPIMYLASVVGVWLFFIQHQFPGVYWVRDSEWDQIKASFLGSSFYDLPPVLRWFTGNIGYHHIHHLDPRIPNYMLQECAESTEEAQVVKPISLRRGFDSLRLHLYDEAKGSLIGFREMARRRGAGS